MYKKYNESLNSATATSIMYGKLKNYAWCESNTNLGEAWQDPSKIKRSSLIMDLTGHPGISKICMQIFRKAMPDFDLDPDADWYCSAKAQKYLPGDYMDWHRDETNTELVSKAPNFIGVDKRVLTFSIPLNEDYDGGDFVLRDDSGLVKHNSMYSAIVFPSTSPHSVEEVKTGTRYTLNSWLYAVKDVNGGQ